MNIPALYNVGISHVTEEMLALAGGPGSVQLFSHYLLGFEECNSV